MKVPLILALLIYSFFSLHYYVDYYNGVTEGNCDDKQSPCKSLSYLSKHLRNATDATILIHCDEKPNYIYDDVYIYLNGKIEITGSSSTNEGCLMAFHMGSKASLVLDSVILSVTLKNLRFVDFGSTTNQKTLDIGVEGTFDNVNISLSFNTQIFGEVMNNGYIFATDNSQAQQHSLDIKSFFNIIFDTQGEEILKSPLFKNQEDSRTLFQDCSFSSNFPLIFQNQKATLENCCFLGSGTYSSVSMLAVSSNSDIPLIQITDSSKVFFEAGSISDCESNYLFSISSSSELTMDGPFTINNNNIKLSIFSNKGENYLTNIEFSQNSPGEFLHAADSSSFSCDTCVFDDFEGVKTFLNCDGKYHNTKMYFKDSKFQHKIPTIHCDEYCEINDGTCDDFYEEYGEKSNSGLPTWEIVVIILSVLFCVCFCGIFILFFLGFFFLFLFGGGVVAVCLFGGTFTSLASCIISCCGTGMGLFIGRNEETLYDKIGSIQGVQKDKNDMKAPELYF